MEKEKINSSDKSKKENQKGIYEVLNEIFEKKEEERKKQTELWKEYLRQFS